MQSPSCTTQEGTATTRRTQPIRKITLADGRVRYRVIYDAGQHPDGRRRQITRTFDLRREAQAELDRVRTQRRQGDYVAPDKLTLNSYLDTWLGGQLDLEPATRRSYTEALRPVRDLLGARKLQSIDAQDIISLVKHMHTQGRRRGGKPGSGLSPRTIQATLITLRRAFRDAVRDRKMAWNPAAGISGPRQHRHRREVWTEAEVRAFMTAITGDRLAGVWRLALLALRPEETCGVRWGTSGVDLDAGTVAVTNARTLVAGKVVEKAPKTLDGERVLPLDAGTVAALRTLHRIQAAEKLAAGTAYFDGGYVTVNELGVPYTTTQLRMMFYKLLANHGLRKVQLYDARRSCLTYLANSGQVPIAIVAAWAGHSDPAVTLRHYVHIRPGDMDVARDAMARLLGA
jgi:integrase